MRFTSRHVSAPQTHKSRRKHPTSRRDSRLLNRYRAKALSRVRIPLSPPCTESKQVVGIVTQSVTEKADKRYRSVLTHRGRAMKVRIKIRVRLSDGTYPFLIQLSLPTVSSSRFMPSSMASPNTIPKETTSSAMRRMVSASATTLSSHKRYSGKTCIDGWGLLVVPSSGIARQRLLPKIKNGAVVTVKITNR
jgi:hypothetical protein